MIKKEMYPATERLKLKNNVFVTEKLDGENLTIFKKEGKLYIATRSCIVNVSNELEIDKQYLYKGLYPWLKAHRVWLEDNVYELSAICGEWLGGGYLNYGQKMTEDRFYMFAKANVEDWSLRRLIYNHDLFKYPFTNIDPEQQVPEFIKIVPEVATLQNIPTVSELDKLYDEYKAKVGRDVEGFVINFQDKICKYVRKKKGIETPHMEKGD